MSSGLPAPRLVDARGMRCPWPALRLARAVREDGAGDDKAGHVVVLADDPNAAGEIGALAAVHGWTVRVSADRLDIWTGSVATSPLPAPR